MVAPHLAPDLSRTGDPAPPFLGDVMVYDPALAIRMEAFSVSMQAKTGVLAAADVDALQSRAEETLDRDDPTFLAVNWFATQFLVARDDRAALAQIGDALSDRIQLINQPDPPDIGRRDIYGG